jgi:putative membrane protein
MLVSAAFSSIIIGAAYTTNLNFNLYSLLTLIPISGIAAYLKYINKGFYEGESHFYTRNGFWNRRTSIVPYYRIQTLDQVQTVFQKRLGLKTIVFDTAGTSVLRTSPKVCDLDTEVSDNLFERIYGRFRDSKI